MTDDTEIGWHKEQKKTALFLKNWRPAILPGATSFLKPNQKSTTSKPRSLNPS